VVETQTQAARFGFGLAGAVMTEIAVRLRNWPIRTQQQNDDDAVEAADTIDVLYEALEKLAAAVEGWDVDELVSNARAALAKARGETNKAPHARIASKRVEASNER
jgi:hypothetical protein